MEDKEPGSSGNQNTAFVQSGGAAATVSNIFEEWRQIITKPGPYFASMPVSGGMDKPIAFYAAVAACNALIALIFGIAHPVNAVISAVIALVAVMISSFIGAAIVMAVSKLFGGTGNYEATYRSCAYASAPHVVAGIPFLNFFAGLYSLYLLKLALERGQNLSSSKAIGVIAVIVGLGIMFSLVAAFLGIAALLRHGS